MQIPEETYQIILRVMPIPCVDVIARNSAGEVLLVRRKDEPAAGDWWFPGGRVYFGETREAAARRKLFEECGLEATQLEELWTCDSMLAVKSSGRVRHGITTLFLINVAEPAQVELNSHSGEFAWKNHATWEAEPLHSFVRDSLGRTKRHFSSQTQRALS